MAEGATPPARTRFEGFVTVSEAAPRGMITLRGDLAAAELAQAVHAAVGLGIPARRQILIAADRAAAWMSPDEMLLIMPPAAVDDAMAAMRLQLAGVFATLADVSDARVAFTLEGKLLDEVLMKLCPVDLGRMGPDEIRRTRAAQSAVAFWRCGDAAATVICFRSVADYVYALLCNAAADGGVLGLR